ncbi:hypothetical protein BDZ45DRAFT_748499 [Acephala macrosclerotiorum]|nr:hypothetical protein BDZ45DRAFT_748499 [Acephala macrosclerotiorum]
MNDDQIERGHICTGCWNSFATDYQLAYHIQSGGSDSWNGSSQKRRCSISSAAEPAEPQPARSLQVVRCPSCRAQFAASAYHLQQVTDCPACHWRFATSQQRDETQAMTNANVDNSFGNQQLTIHQGAAGAPTALSDPAPQVWTCPVCQQQFSTVAQCNDHIQQHLPNSVA